jgi:protein-S-isoprenylcysteine O-methyltransferase Ste14
VALAVFLAVWLLDSLVLRFSTFLAKDMGLPIRLGASVPVLALAVYLMEGGHRAVPHGGRTAAGLITDGAFARVRHPLYAGSLLFYLALVIMTLSLIALAVWCGVFVFYDVIASFEERRLAEAFGPGYEAYRAKVPKWVPRLRAARIG